MYVCIPSGRHGSQHIPGAPQVKWLHLCTCLKPSWGWSRRQRAQSLQWKSWLRFSESQRLEFYIYLFLKPWCLAQTNIQKICWNENLFAQKEAVKDQVRIAIWHMNKAALIPPTITQSPCGENGLIVKSRRYFHSVNFLTSGDHSLVLLSLWPLWSPPPSNFLLTSLFLQSASGTSLFLWSSNDWFPVWGSLIFLFFALSLEEFL